MGGSSGLSVYEYLPRTPSIIVECASDSMNSIEIDDIRIDGGCSVIRREKKPKFHIVIRVLCAALWTCGGWMNPGLNLRGLKRNRNLEQA